MQNIIMKEPRRILIVTNMYPHTNRPNYGTFVKEQIKAIKDLKPSYDIEIFFIKGYINPFIYLKAIFQVRKLVQKKEFDIIHAHYGLSGFVCCFQRKVPVICTFHGDDVQYIQWQGVISRITSLLIKHSIAVSPNIKKKLPSKNVSVIPCGVFFDLFKPFDKKKAKSKLGLDLQKSYILFPGNPKVIRKNYALFRKVINLLKVHFNDIEELILWGFNRKEVMYALNSAEVVLFTSFSEGSVTVLKEALACNIPVVSVDVGDSKEVLHKLPGCYITTYDANELFEKISKVLREKKQVNFRNKIQRFSNKKIAKQIINLYQNI